MSSNPQDTMLDEFGSYYNADELELFIHDGLAEQADESAERMVHILGDRAAEVAELLRHMAADPAHPLFETLRTQTMYDWNADPGSWAKFQELARRISDGITKATSG